MLGEFHACRFDERLDTEDETEERRYAFASACEEETERRGGGENRFGFLPPLKQHRRLRRRRRKQLNKFTIRKGLWRGEGLFTLGETHSWRSP